MIFNFSRKFKLLRAITLFDNVLTMNILSFHSGRKITGLGAY